MKPCILIAGLWLAGFAAAAQQPITSYGHFKVDGHELIWQHVIDTTLHAEDLRTFYSHLSRVADVTMDENTLLASFDRLTFDGRWYGGTGFHWITTKVLSGKLKVDLKSDRYRITLYDLRFVEYDEHRLEANHVNQLHCRYEPAADVFLLRDALAIKPNFATPGALGA
ncbi:hypothetical protein, partial [Dawidia soli]